LGNLLQGIKQLPPATPRQERHNSEFEAIDLCSPLSPKVTLEQLAI
jgi:hypothetical protein